MKRIVLIAAAAIAFAAPLASATMASAAPGDRYERREDRREYRQDRREDRRENHYERRDDHRDYRAERRDDRRDYRQNRWDGQRYNGYYYNNRWAYGPPPAQYYSHPSYRPGYNQWRRGAYLPTYYRGYVVNDYHRYRLRPPPRGYHWVRANNDYVLAAIATGLIFEVIRSSSY